MQLNIASPTQKKSFLIVWIDIETPVGSFVIQPEHAPMIIELLQDSKVTYCLNSGKQETIKINKGLAHVTRNSVTLLLSE